MGRSTLVLRHISFYPKVGLAAKLQCNDRKLATTARLINKIELERELENGRYKYPDQIKKNVKSKLDVTQPGN